MVRHPAAPNILRSNTVPFPELQHHQWGTHLLARQQLEMSQFLPGREVQSGRLVAFEAGGPLAGPADDRDQAAAVVGDVEVGVSAVGRPAAGGGKGVGRLWAQARGVGLVARRRAIVPGVVVQDEFIFRTPAELDIQGTDVGQDGRLPGAGVLEEERPLHSGKILIGDGPTADDQSRLGIGPGEQVLGTLVIELLLRDLPVPGRQKRSRWLAVIGEGKEPRGPGLLVREVVPNPIVLESLVLRSPGSLGRQEQNHGDQPHGSADHRHLPLFVHDIPHGRKVNY